jgi:putative ABC transport system permease protein
MTGVVLKGLLGRKFRAILTSFAIVLGVAMVSGTFVLTDTIQKAFDGVFKSSYADTSVTVSGKEIVKGSLSGKATVPEPLLARVRALPDVAAASGQLIDFASNTDTVKLVKPSGATIGGSGGAPNFGFGVDAAQPRFNPLKLATGHWASGPHQVVIDASTAKDEHYAVGDRIGAAADGPTRQYTISGIAKLGDLSSIGSATIAAFDVPTAQALLHKRGRFDVISVAAKPGVSQEQVASQIEPLLPRSADVRTAEQQVQQDQKDTSEGISVIRIFLLVFGGIALFVGAFVIFNTISITVAQRAREFATLRTLGASRRQVLRSVLLESFVIGVVASIIGLVLGIGLAKGLNAIFVAFGIDLPQTGTVLATRTVIVSLLTGTVITVLAGIVPALRATRVPPITAVREGAVLPAPRHARLRPYVAGTLIALAVVLMAAGIFGGTSGSGVLLPLGAGTLLLFIAIAMISSHLVRPLARVVGAPARRIGGFSGELANQNAVRNPGRTASTAAALMIGLALVTFVATLGAGLRSSDEDALKDQVRSDYVVSSTNDGGSVPVAAGAKLAASPQVTVASSVRSDQARVLGDTVDVAGVDPATITRVYKFDWTQGSDATASGLGDGAIVMKAYADDHDLKVGSPLRLQTPAGESRQVVVKGVYDPPEIDSLFSGILISQRTFDRAFPRPTDLFSFVDVQGGATAGATSGLQRSLDAFPDSQIQTKAAWVKDRAAQINIILDLFYVLLALSVIVSMFGMINTLVLSVFERTRELGMLRAVGMTRIQMRRMIRHESIITALIGAALGLPLGLFLAALVTRGLSDQGVGFHVPLVPLVAFTLVALVAGVLAAILPARRASRLNVLQALQYE